MVKRTRTPNRVPNHVTVQFQQPCPKQRDTGQLGHPEHQEPFSFPSH
jgi:hypothetical protein